MSSRVAKPAKHSLVDVLAAVRPGNAVRLSLTPAQKRALADPDGRIALNVVRHLLGARASSVKHGKARDAFPVTAETFAAVARKLGTPVGTKRARALTHRLRAADVLTFSGSYPQRYGSRYRVKLYRLGTVAASLLSQLPVGRRQVVKRKKRLRWYEHPLFGEPDGRPPPGLTKKRANQMRSRDELEWARG